MRSLDDYAALNSYQNALRKTAMDILKLTDAPSPQDFRQIHFLAAWLAQAAQAAEHRFTAKD